MIRRRTIGGVPCTLQRVPSARKLLSMLREPCTREGSALGVDWFHGDRPWSRGFFGFSGPEELEDMLLHGVRDAADPDPGRGRESRAERRSERRRDVAGAVPIVPAAVAGDPACMVSLRRAPVMERRTRLCVDVGAPYWIPGEDLRAAGRAVAAAIRGMTDAGFQVGLDLTYTVATDDGRVYGLAVPLKRMDEPLNMAKCMLLAEPAMSRGVGFCWSAHMEGFAESDMGHEISRVFPTNLSDEDVLFCTLSPNCVHCSISEIAKIGTFLDEKQTSAWVRGLIGRLRSPHAHVSDIGHGRLPGLVREDMHRSVIQ